MTQTLNDIPLTDVTEEFVEIVWELDQKVSSGELAYAELEDAIIRGGRQLLRESDLHADLATTEVKTLLQLYRSMEKEQDLALDSIEHQALKLRLLLKEHVL